MASRTRLATAVPLQALPVAIVALLDRESDAAHVAPRLDRGLRVAGFAKTQLDVGEELRNHRDRPRHRTTDHQLCQNRDSDTV